MKEITFTSRTNSDISDDKRRRHLLSRDKRRLSTRKFFFKLKEIALKLSQCIPCLRLRSPKERKYETNSVMPSSPVSARNKVTMVSAVNSEAGSAATTKTGVSYSSSAYSHKNSQSGASEEERRLKEVEGHVLDTYNIIRRVGKGAYGIVWEAEEKDGLRRKVALKKIFDAFRNGTDAQRTYREVSFLRALEPHPLIVKLLKIHPSENEMDLYLVFPFIHTDLHKVIKWKPKLLNDNHRMRKIAYEIVVATNYLHSAQIIHRDLKPANVLLDKNFNVQLADFGLARTLYEDVSTDSTMELHNGEMTDYVATRWYRPPEILLSARTYTKGVDMWSIGCIVAEMIIKEPLFPGENTNDQVELILQTILPPSREEVDDFIRGTKGSVSGAIIETVLAKRGTYTMTELFKDEDVATVDFMERLLKFCPASRLSASQALTHPFFEGYRNESMEFVSPKMIEPFFNDNSRLDMEEYRRVLFDPEKYFPVRNGRDQAAEEANREDELDKFYRNEERLWKEQRKWIPRPPTRMREKEEDNYSSNYNTRLVRDIGSGGGDETMTSALERAENAVNRTIKEAGSRQSKSIMTLSTPIQSQSYSFPSLQTDYLLKGGIKPPGTPVDPTNMSSLERDIGNNSIAKLNNNYNSTSLVKKGSSSSINSKCSIRSTATSTQQTQLAEIGSSSSNFQDKNSYLKMSTFSESKGHCGTTEDGSNNHTDPNSSSSLVDERGDRGILEKFHELCLKYNFDLPLEEGHGSVKNLLVEHKKNKTALLPPPPPSPPGKDGGTGGGDYMQWPVPPTPVFSNPAPTKTNKLLSSSSSYKSYTNSSTSLESNCNFNTSLSRSNLKQMKGFVNPYKPAGLKSGLSSLSVPGSTLRGNNEAGGDGIGGMMGSRPYHQKHESSPSLLDLFPPSKDTGVGSLKHQNLRSSNVNSFQQRGKLSASVSSSLGSLPALPLPRSQSNNMSSSSSAGSLRNKPPVGPPRSSVTALKSNLIMMNNNQKTGQQQQQQAQNQQTQPFRRPFGGITYSKKFTGPTFRKKGVGTSGTDDGDIEGWKTAGRQSAYFPNAGLAHPMAPAPIHGDSNKQSLSRQSSSGSQGSGAMRGDSSKGHRNQTGGMGSLPPPPASTVVTASDLFELKNNIHRHHDPHRHRRQLR